VGTEQHAIGSSLILVPRARRGVYGLGHMCGVLHFTTKVGGMSSKGLLPSYLWLFTWRYISSNFLGGGGFLIAF
jgi:hypothetical protein